MTTSVFCAKEKELIKRTSKKVQNDLEFINE
jgi:hypothetical protein